MGHMGSGKSIFGKKIAHYLNVELIDIDREISKYENSTINDIFLSKGEIYFRKIEALIALDILEKKNVIISLGGGSILNKETRDKIKKHSFSIFLDVDIYILNKRLKKSKNRPLLKDGNILTILQQLDKQRRKYYTNADFTIKNSSSVNAAFLSFQKKILSKLRLPSTEVEVVPIMGKDSLIMMEEDREKILQQIQSDLGCNVCSHVYCPYKQKVNFSAPEIEFC